MADILAAGWHHLATDWPVSGIPTIQPCPSLFEKKKLVL